MTNYKIDISLSNMVWKKLGLNLNSINIIIPNCHSIELTSLLYHGHKIICDEITILSKLK